MQTLIARDTLQLFARADRPSACEFERQSGDVPGSLGASVVRETLGYVAR